MKKRIPVKAVAAKNIAANSSVAKHSENRFKESIIAVLDVVWRVCIAALLFPAFFLLMLKGLEHNSLFIHLLGFFSSAVLGGVCIEIVISHGKLEKLVYIVGTITMFVVISASIYLYFDAFNLPDNAMAFETQSSTERVGVSLDRAIREKGKEPIYVVSGGGMQWELSEETYNKYIGDDNNTITMNYEKLTIYVSKDRINPSFEEYDWQTLVKVSAPWEPKAEPFSMEEIYDFKRQIIEDNRACNSHGKDSSLPDSAVRFA